MDGGVIGLDDRPHAIVVCPLGAGEQLFADHRAVARPQQLGAQLDHDLGRGFLAIVVADLEGLDVEVQDFGGVDGAAAFGQARAATGLEGADQRFLEQHRGGRNPTGAADIGRVGAGHGQDAVGRGGGFEAQVSARDHPGGHRRQGGGRLQRLAVEAVELGRLGLGEQRNAAAQGHAGERGQGQPGRF